MSKADPLPATRADCIDGPRPCPHTTCKWHMHEFATRSNHGTPPTESCSLDVADKGPHTFAAVAEAIGRTKEAVRQIEELALRRLRARAPLLGIVGDDAVSFQLPVNGWDYAEADT